MVERIGKLPIVPTHGDFNPCNILPGGVIDFAYHFEAPLGYDWAALLMNTYYFSDDAKDITEMSRKFTYTDLQFDSLLNHFDDIYKAKGINKTFREVLPYFALIRMVWSAAHMEHRPKLQDWRFKKLNAAMQELLSNQSKVEISKLLDILKD